MSRDGLPDRVSDRWSSKYKWWGKQSAVHYMKKQGMTFTGAILVQLTCMFLYGFAAYIDFVDLARDSAVYTYRSAATFGFTFWSSSLSLIEEPHSVKCLRRNNDPFDIWKHLLITTSYMNLEIDKHTTCTNKCTRRGELTRQDMIGFTRKHTN